MARAARWADGIAGFLLDPLHDDAPLSFRAAEAAWAAAGRPRPHVATSFWYALGPGGAEQVQAYARQYLGIYGDDVANAMADMVSITTPTALRDALDRMAEAGCDEVILVPTSDALGELEGVVELLA
jgi:hypothetical protein